MTNTLQETRFGFIWGDVHVERCCSDPKLGQVLQIKTPRGWWQVRITPSGLVKCAKEGTK